MSEEIDDFYLKYKIIASKNYTNDEIFFYGVKTTGIFCKPNCSSRLPKPENVIFFNSSQEAIQKGYRPCKRCNPLHDGISDHSELVISICRLIEESENVPGLKKLSEKTGYSEGHLQKVFKKITGISPKKYAAALREDKLRDELQSNSSITSKIYNAGYGSSSRVYENVNRILAMSPSQFQNSGKGIQMRIGVFSCFIGVVLIALTDHGVSAVDLGDNEKVLVLSFRQRFKNAQISELNTDDKDAVTSVLKKIENPGMSLDIPIDIHGTVFQKKVWSALTNIPSGETKTYSEIASEIGQPSSVRAVANACGKNNLAVLIPCHRVVRKNGAIAGYRWGREKKQQLLDYEK